MPPSSKFACIKMVLISTMLAHAKKKMMHSKKISNCSFTQLLKKNIYINKNISFSIESTAPKYQNIFDTDWASGSTIDWGSTGTTDEFKVHAVGGELKSRSTYKLEVRCQTAI